MTKKLISELGLSEKQKLISNINSGKVLKIEDKVAYFGLVLVQGSLLPSHFSGIFPHWTLPFFLIIGLCCYQYRNRHDENIQNVRLYSIGNYCGITLNILMLIKLGVA